MACLLPWKQRQSIHWIIICASIFILRNSVTEGSKSEKLLFAKLFGQDYNEAVRPVNSGNDTVAVNITMNIHQIVDVQTKSQTLIMSVFIKQKWRNEILTWDPNEYGNITQINVDPKHVWKPDIVLYTNADEDKTFGGNLDRLNTRIQLYNTGLVVWLAPIILRSACSIDVKYFPFDTQNCSLKFGSWTYSQERLDLNNGGEDKANTANYEANSEWKLISTENRVNYIKYPCCDELYPDVTFYIVISRRSLFYLCNLIFPMTIIGMLTMLSFLLPAESGERISLAITLLLAMTVFMLVVADIIPATSDVIPLVGIFFSASMVEMVAMIVVLCYIMRLYHKGPNDPPMPNWMRNYILEGLAYKIKVRKPKAPAEQDETQNATTECNRDENEQMIGDVGGETEPMFSNRGQLREVSLNKNSAFSNTSTTGGGGGGGSGTMTVVNHFRPQLHPSSSSNINHPNINREKWNNQHSQQHLQPLLWMTKQHQHFNINHNLNNHRFNNRLSTTPPDDQQQLINNKPPTEAEIILNKLNILIKKLKDMDEEDEITSEWRTVAMTLDRCLLVFFFFVYFVTIFACFLGAPGYVS